MLSLIADHGEEMVFRITAKRVDAPAVLEFKQSYREALSNRAPKRVILDMEEVDFLDSSGLGALVAMRKHLGADTAVALSGLQPLVDRVMRLTSMDHVFALHPTTHDALAQSHGR